MRAALSTRARDIAFPVALSGALTWYNNIAGRRSWHHRWYPLVNGGAAAAVVAAAAASGLTTGELGLRRDRLRAGLGLGAAAAAPVAAAYAVAVLVPAARPPLRDKRVAGLTGRQLVYQMLVRIPAGTVGWEEIAFRGALHAALCRVLPRPAAIAAGGAVFGIWHIRPAAEALGGNGLAAGPAARAAAVAAVVTGTAAAGALLSVLRDRSGSLAAPAAVHLAANCLGPLAAALSARLERSEG
jgi:membrane protease YdiL (CAAX protease family)